MGDNQAMLKDVYCVQPPWDGWAAICARNGIDLATMLAYINRQYCTSAVLTPQQMRALPIDLLSFGLEQPVEEKTSHPFLSFLLIVSSLVIVGTGAWLWKERHGSHEEDKLTLINRKRGIFIGTGQQPYLELVENTLR